MNLNNVIKTLHQSDILFATIFSFFSLLFMLWSFFKQNYTISIITLPFVVFISSTFYLFYSNRFFYNDFFISKFKESTQVRLVSHIIFVISLSLMMWIFSNNLYYRPPLYFYLILVASLSIILNIIFLDESKNSEVLIVLLKISILCFFIYRDLYYQFPGIRGIDPWEHNQVILETLEMKHISAGLFNVNQYFLFPLFHISAALTQIVTNFSIYSSIFASTGILMISSYLFIFIIGKGLFNSKIGMLSMLIVALSPYSISRANMIIAMSLGFIFFIEILYCMVGVNNRTISHKVLFVILSFSLILTHTIASFVTLMFLIFAFITVTIYKKIFGTVIHYYMISFSTLLFFGTIMLYRWIQDQPGRWSFLNLNIAMLINSLNIDSQFILDSQTSISQNISPFVGIFDNFSFYIIIGFAIIGCLVSLRTKKENIRTIILLFLSGLLIIVPYLFMAFQLRNILPDRWFIFSYVPISFFFIIGLLKVSDLFKNKRFALLFTIIIILTSVFFMTTNSLSNDESPLLFNGATRSGYTQSEINAISTIFNMIPLDPTTDDIYGFIIPKIVGYENYENYALKENNNEIFIQRNYYLNKPEWNDKYISKIRNHEEIGEVVISEYITKNRIDKNPIIYNNGNVKAYYIVKLSQN